MFANFYQVPAALSKLTRFTRGNFVTQIGKNLVHIAARGIKRLHKLGRLQAGVKTARSHVVFLGCIKTSWDLSFCQFRKLRAASWSKAQEAQLEIAGRVDKSFLPLILLIEWISQLLRVTLTLKHSDSVTWLTCCNSLHLSDFRRQWSHLVIYKATLARLTRLTAGEPPPTSAAASWTWGSHIQHRVWLWLVSIHFNSSPTGN